MTRDPNATYWAIKRRQRAAVVAAPAAEPVKAPSKADLVAQAEAAGIEVKAGDTKADIAAKLAGE